MVSVNHNQLVFEAMLVMLRHNVHHLPVLDNLRPVGVVALSDIIRYESRNSLFLVGSIFRQQSQDELAALVPEVRACFARMVGEDASSQMIGSAMAAIGRSFKQRLLELAEAELGPPPVPYCFLALGSMARQEQLIVTDQDNALVLDNRFDPAQHDAYFKALAAFVSDGLARCGYSYCTGGVMATNEQVAPAPARCGSAPSPTGSSARRPSPCSTPASSSTSTACGAGPSGRPACAS